MRTSLRNTAVQGADMCSWLMLRRSCARLSVSRSMLSSARLPWRSRKVQSTEPVALLWCAAVPGVRLLKAPLGPSDNTLPCDVQPRPSSSVFGYISLLFEIRACRKTSQRTMLESNVRRKQRNALPQVARYMVRTNRKCCHNGSGVSLTVLYWHDGILLAHFIIRRNSRKVPG